MDAVERYNAALNMPMDDMDFLLDHKHDQYRAVKAVMSEFFPDQKLEKQEMYRYPSVPIPLIKILPFQVPCITILTMVLFSFILGSNHLLMNYVLTFFVSCAAYYFIVKHGIRVPLYRFKRNCETENWGIDRCKVDLEAESEARNIILHQSTAISEDSLEVKMKRELQLTMFCLATSLLLLIVTYATESIHREIVLWLFLGVLSFPAIVLTNYVENYEKHVWRKCRRVIKASLFPEKRAARALRKSRFYSDMEYEFNAGCFQGDDKIRVAQYLNDYKGLLLD